MTAPNVPAKYSSSVVQQTAGLALLLLYIATVYVNIQGSVYIDNGILLPSLEVLGGLLLLVLSAMSAHKAQAIPAFNKNLMKLNVVIAVILLGGTGFLFFFGLVFALAMGGGATSSLEISIAGLPFVAILLGILAVVVIAQGNHWRKLQK